MTPRQAISSAFEHHGEPVVLRPLISGMLGGGDPLEGVLVYNAGDDWLCVSQGLSALDLDGGGGKRWLELTLRVPKTVGLTNWVSGLMNTLARYLNGQEKRFERFHHFNLQKPIDGDDSKFQGGLVVPDVEAPTVETEGGRLPLFQIVGLTSAEIAACDAGRAMDIYTRLADADARLVTAPRDAIQVGPREPMQVVFEGYSGRKKVQVEVDGWDPNIKLNGKDLSRIDLSKADLCPRSTVLQLFENRLKTLDLRKLDGHPRLETMWLYDNGTTKTHLDCHLPALLKIALAGNKLKSFAMPDLAQWPRIRDVLVADTASLVEVDLSGAAGSQTLEVVDLTNTGITHIDLAPLKDCPALEEVNLYSTKLESVDLAPLADKTRLREINIHNNRLTEVDLSPMATLPALHKVDLGKNRLTHVDLSPLAACPSLEQVFVYETPLTSVCLDGLAASESIWCIDLADNQLTAVDLSGLEGSKTLKKLLLDNNPLEQVDITAIAACPMRGFTVDKSVKVLCESRFQGKLPPAFNKVLPQIEWI